MKVDLWVSFYVFCISNGFISGFLGRFGFYLIMLRVVEAKCGHEFKGFLIQNLPFCQFDGANIESRDEKFSGLWWFVCLEVNIF